MEIRTIKIGKNTWQLINDSWKTSNAWGHKTNVLRNGYDFGEYKCRYYNRTWESYTYQSCMFSAINRIKEKELNDFIENYKINNDIIRFKKGQKDEIIKEFNRTELGKELKKVYNAIELRKFG